MTHVLLVEGKVNTSKKAKTYFSNRGSMISHFLFVISTHLLYVRLLSRTHV